MDNACQECGRPLPDRHGIVLDDDAGELFCRDQKVDLQKMETRFIRALIDRPGRVVANDVILSDMHFDRPDIDWPESPQYLGVYAASLRKKLRPFGFTVTNYHAHGYRLEVVDG